MSFYFQPQSGIEMSDAIDSKPVQFLRHKVICQPFNLKNDFDEF